MILVLLVLCGLLQTSSTKEILSHSDVIEMRIDNVQCVVSSAPLSVNALASWLQEVSRVDQRVSVSCHLPETLKRDNLQSLCNTSQKSNPQFTASIQSSKANTLETTTILQETSCLCRARYAHKFCAQAHSALADEWSQSPLFSNLVASDPVEIADIMSPLNWVATYTVFQMVLIAPAVNLLLWCCRGPRPYPVQK